jgi:Ca-activated chloride channel family protein
MTVLENITFAQPLFLLLLPLVLLLFYLRSRKKYYAEVRLSSTSGFQGSTTWKTRLRPIQIILQTIALVALIIALARPQSLLRKEKINAEAIDIMLALDVSTSMLAKDFKEDRLDASKRVAQVFVDKRKYDRIGIVFFGGESYTQCPLTTDHAIVKQCSVRTNSRRHSLRNGLGQRRTPPAKKRGQKQGLYSTYRWC